MLAISSAHPLASAAPSAAIAVPLAIIFGALLLGALLLGAILWFRERSQRHDQRRERALQRLTVAQLMEPAKDGAPITMTLAELDRQYTASPESHSLHVTQWGQLVGMISPRDLRRIPEERWPSTRAGAAMTPLERVLTLEPEQSLLEAYRLMLHREIDHAPVVVRGRVVGMLNRDTVRQLTAEQKAIRIETADQRLPVAN